MIEGSTLALEHRAPIYSWLSRLLVREIQPSDWEALRSQPIRSILVRLEPNLATELGRDLCKANREELDEEFARLFLLPGGVSPFATHWIASTSKEQQEKTRDEISVLVERSLAAIGRSPIHDEPWGRIPKDHIAVLFDLIAEAEASSDVRDREVAAHLDRELLGEWIASFGNALEEQARNPLYRALGGVVVALHSPAPGLSNPDT